MTLTWQPPLTGGVATHYIIEVADAGGNVGAAFDTLNNATNFIYANAPPGTYQVRLRAANAAGTGAATAFVTVTIAP